MIGSSDHGGLVFWMSDSMFSDAFDVLIKILESYRSQIPSSRRKMRKKRKNERKIRKDEWGRKRRTKTKKGKGEYDWRRRIEMLENSSLGASTMVGRSG